MIIIFGSLFDLFVTAFMCFFYMRVGAVIHRNGMNKVFFSL